MAVLAASPVHPYHDELMDLRTRAVRMIAGGEMILAFVIVEVWALRVDLTGPENVIVASLFAGSAAAAWLVVERSYRCAALVLTAGALAGVASAAILWSSREPLYALPLILFVAPLLVDFRYTLLLTALESALVVAMATPRLVPASDAEVPIILLLILATAGLSWVAYQPMRVTIAWTWSSYVEQRRKTDEVRERQAELAKLSKSLVEACEQLEQANLALAEARRAAEQARHLKDEFATAISHELRTPINLIIGFSELIVDDRDEPVPTAFRRDVETIYRNACHLSTLVDDVLDLGRLDARRLALVKSWSSLPAIVADAIQTIKELYDNAGIEVGADLPPDLPRVYVDPTRVRQVLINLLTNAVRYVEDGSVRIAARSEEGEIVVSVADTGAGIAPEDLPHVFERFQQTGQFHRRGGFGLGLTVSKQLIEMHGGSMWVTSTMNQGTTFSFSLPAGTNVVASPPNPRLGLLEPRYLDQSAARTVLVVGQDPDAVRIFQRYLEGFRVRMASSAEEVYGIGRKSVVNAVVIANATSDDVARAVRDRFRGVPTLRCSLHTVARASSQLGVAAFLTKPVSAGQLRQTLRRLSLKPRQALVVEDDPDMARLLCRMIHLIAPPCRVRTTTSAEDALAVARADGREPPDLVLLDLLLPEMDGHSFINTWNGDAALQRTPIVVVSAATEEDHDLIVAESVEIRRADGLSVAELLGVVRGSLDWLLPSARAPTLSVADDGRRWQNVEEAAPRG